MKHPILFGALLLLASCSSTPGTAKYEPLPLPRGYPEFTNVVQDGAVRAKCVYFGNHAEIFARDMPTADGLLPIGVEIYIDPRVENEVGRRMIWDDLDARLYLQDGTALTAIQPRYIRIEDPPALARINQFALRQDFLDEEGGTQFLYFRFDPEQLEIREAEVMNWSRLPKHMDLTGSLVSINLTRDDDRLERLFIGLELDRQSASALQLQ